MTDRDFVVLSRDALMAFFGAVALPSGSGAPTDTDCAPIAARIIEWVAEHDVSGTFFNLSRERSDWVDPETLCDADD